jgi:hypothetical protein
MKPRIRFDRALLFGLLGALCISLVSVLLRLVGVPVRLELILGSAFGIRPGPEAFALGLAVHLAIGMGFGALYGFLFERVWSHGGAATGMIFGVMHAALIGMFVGLTPQFHPFVPSVIPDPGPYFANAGAAGVISFFALHVLYGFVVGAGYGHVAAEHQWAPEGRL